VKAQEIRRGDVHPLFRFSSFVTFSFFFSFYFKNARHIIY